MLRCGECSSSGTEPRPLAAGSIPPRNAGCFAVNACRSINYVYARTVCVFLALQRSARAACGSNAAEFAWKCTREQRIEAPTGGGRSFSARMLDALTEGVRTNQGLTFI